MDKTFIFDYDDTLAPNHNDYSYAQLKFGRWVIKKLKNKAPDLQTIINLEVEIDRKLVKTMGFLMERFPTSFQKTYEIICEEKDKKCSKEDLKKAYDVGMSAFDEKRWKQEGLVEGAKETLDYLVEKEKDELILLTKGDPRVQEKKIRATNCMKWFGDKIYIVPDKNEGIIKKVVGNRVKSKVWHVGNSIRSDVYPALKARIKMIYIPCETWAYEREHKGVPEDPKLITFQQIIEIKNNYNSLV